MNTFLDQIVTLTKQRNLLSGMYRSTRKNLNTISTAMDFNSDEIQKVWDKLNIEIEENARA